MLASKDFAKAVGESLDMLRFRINTEAEPWATSPQDRPGAHRRYRGVHCIGWAIATTLAEAGLTFDTAAEAVRATEAAEKYIAAAAAGLPTDLWLAVLRIAWRDGDGLHTDLRFEVGTGDQIARMAAAEADQFARPYGGGFHMGVAGIVSVSLLTAYARAHHTARAAGYELSTATLEPLK